GAAQDFGPLCCLFVLLRSLLPVKARPWWERYQPTCYNLCSRSSNENELRDMITRCNNVRVNIYVDAVINHICKAGAGEGSHSDFPSKVADYMNKLIDMDVAGFRVDACKHMWPGDLESVCGHLPFIYQEVIDLGHELITSREYFHLGRVTEFKYGANLGTVLCKWNGEKLSYTEYKDGAVMPNGNALVFVDNRDNQRGHGAGGASIVTFWDSRLYKMAVGYMLAHPYGVARVMSSFRWNRNIVNGKEENDWMGLPIHCSGATKPVPMNRDQTCGDGWVCEHRWHQIKNMVILCNMVNGQPHTNWWDNQTRLPLDVVFIIFNNDDYLDVTLNTGMPGGTYCDVISGRKDGGRCTGKQITVGGDGRAHFKISNRDEDPFVAIHADSKL
uniref:alpha-amylase n=1 Tax=Myripristis murdjan TaxID=586833 RepID=A0A668ACI3_9TELE